MRPEFYMLELGFAYVGQCQLTVWHRPLFDQVGRLKETIGITMIITIQSHEELPQEIERACKMNGLKYYHLPLGDATKKTLNDLEICKFIQDEVNKLYSIFHEKEEKVLIHCGAGIHRSGIVAYSLIRKTGLNSSDSMQVVRGIRRETAQGVGEWRIELVEKNIIENNLQKYIK